MNRFLPALSVLLITNLALAKNKPAAVTNCDEKAFQAKGLQVFRNPENKTIWLAASNETVDMFSELGFEQVDLKDKSLSHTLVLVNSRSCSPTKAPFKIFYARETPHSVATSSHCEERIAKDLGFAEGTIENYGSMEAGLIVPWNQLNVCTDGKSVFHCASPTSTMEKCFRGFVRAWKVPVQKQ